MELANYELRVCIPSQVRLTLLLSAAGVLVEKFLFRLRDRASAYAFIPIVCVRSGPCPCRLSGVISATDDGLRRFAVLSHFLLARHFYKSSSTNGP